MKLFQLHEDQFKAAVAIVYDDHGNLLLGKAKTDDDRNGKWCFPGGGMKPGECPGSAAARECWEETGYKVKPQQMAFRHHERPGVAFVVCRKLEGCDDPNHEFSKIDWVPREKWFGLDELYPVNLNILRNPVSNFP